jgi:hypothetical protein
MTLLKKWLRVQNSDCCKTGIEALVSSWRDFTFDGNPGVPFTCSGRHKRSQVASREIPPLALEFTRRVNVRHVTEADWLGRNVA